MPIEFIFHTEDPESRALVEAYWARDAMGAWVELVTNLAERQGYRTTHEVTKAVRNAAVAFDPDLRCTRCSEPFVLNSRTHHAEMVLNRDNLAPCTTCRAAARDALISAQEDADAEKRYRILSVYEVPPSQPFDASFYALDTLVYLLALIRLSADEEIRHCEPPRTAARPFAPTPELATEVLQRLFRRQLIYPDPLLSPLHAFVEGANDELRFYLDKVHWVLLLGETPSERVEALRALGMALQREARHDAIAVAELWLRLAKQEVYAYLDLAFRERSLDFTPGAKTEVLIDTLVRTYSIGQIACLIYGAAANAIDYGVRKQLNRKHQANLVISNLQTRHEKAQTNGWEIKSFSRNYDLPLSAISETFFQTTLGIHDIWGTPIPDTLLQALAAEESDVDADSFNNL